MKKHLLINLFFVFLFLPAQVQASDTFIYPQSCPATACPAGLTCEQGNCVQCGTAKEIFPPAEQSTLSEYARKRGLLIGAQMEECLKLDIGNPALCKSLVAREYGNGGVSAIQAGALMKEAEPQQGQFDFTRLDQGIAFARENNLKLHYFHLVWKAKSSPRWLFPTNDETQCGNWTKEELDQILKDFITKMVSHGADDFYAWNVVNEAFDDTGYIRNRCFYQIMGEDYIKNSFRYARAANPKAILVLNDYFGNKLNRRKTEGLFAFVKQAKSEGVPIDAVGIQTHLIEAHRLTPDQYAEDFRWFLNKAKDAGVMVFVTETDVYEGPDNDWQHQKAIYKAVVKTCLEFSHCVAFYAWGVTDNKSWLRDPDGPNIPDADPLLYDRDFQRKPAYYGVMEAIRENTTRACTASPTPAPTSTPTPTPKLGDLNHDGKVDILDYNILVADFGKTGTPGWIPADIIKDGKVDIFDYNQLVTNFGK